MVNLLWIEMKWQALATFYNSKSDFKQWNLWTLFFLTKFRSVWLSKTAKFGQSLKNFSFCHFNHVRDKNINYFALSRMTLICYWNFLDWSSLILRWIDFKKWFKNRFIFDKLVHIFNPFYFIKKEKLIASFTAVELLQNCIWKTN